MARSRNTGLSPRGGAEANSTALMNTLLRMPSRSSTSRAHAVRMKAIAPKLPRRPALSVAARLAMSTGVGTAIRPAGEGEYGVGENRQRRQFKTPPQPMNSGRRAVEAHLEMARGGEQSEEMPVAPTVPPIGFAQRAVRIVG